MRFKLKHIFYILGLIFIGYLGYNYKLVKYGLGQAKGQFNILWEAKEIEEVLNDSTFPDSLKETLNLVSDIKRFAVDSLGLKPNHNYETVFDQEGKEILWVVIACDPYKFEPVIWSFPVIGSFTYKGFFNYEKAVTLARQKKEEGYDVSLRSVSAWSTLGWFRDPILSNMLADGPGELANTIIHELTHGTIFVPDSMTFNENLATFIGNKGAEAFLKYRYGANSEEYINYSQLLIDRSAFTNYIIKSTLILDSLYIAFSIEPDSNKNIMKESLISKIVTNLDTVKFINPDRYQDYFQKYLPNNAYFISFLNYRERQEVFQTMLDSTMNKDLGSFIEFWRVNYRK